MSTLRRGLIVAGLLVPVALVSVGAVRLAMESRAAPGIALERQVLDRNIAFLEGRLHREPANLVIAGELLASYMSRFRHEAAIVDVRRAEALARSALRSNPDTSASLATLAGTLLPQHRFSEAYEAAGEAARRHPDDDRVLSALHDAAVAVGDYGEAARALERLDLGSIAGLVRHANRLLDDERPEAAHRLLRRACRRFDEVGAGREARAWCLTQLAEAERAHAGDRAANDLLDLALAIDPHNRGALEARAWAAYVDGDWSAAERDYRRIASAAHPDITLRLAEVVREQGRIAEAARLERRFQQEATAEGMVRLGRLPFAIYRAEAGACAEALAALGEELDERRSVEALEAGAWVAVMCNQISKAESLLAEARATGRGTASGEVVRRRLASIRDRGAEQRAPDFVDWGDLEPWALRALRSWR